MYSDIRNDYMFGPAVGDKECGWCSGDGLYAGISIDAWESMDADEMGKTVATALVTAHGDTVTVWHDADARGDKEVLTAAEEAAKKLKELWNEEHSGRQFAVICYALHEKRVASFDVLPSYREAEKFLTEDARNTYEEETASTPDARLEMADGHAQLTSCGGEWCWTWEICPVPAVQNKTHV